MLRVARTRDTCVADSGISISLSTRSNMQFERTLVRFVRTAERHCRTRDRDDRLEPPKARTAG
jgi:hypothetical protein